MLNRDYGKKSSGPQKMADGGSVGFFESLKQLGDRLTAGNIDQEGSEAYNRWGAGRAKIDSAYADSSRAKDVEQPAPATVVARPSVPAPDSVKYPDTEFGDLAGAQSRVASDDLKAVADANDKSTPAAATVIAAPRKRARVSKPQGAVANAIDSANAISNRRDEWAYRTAQDKANSPEAEARKTADSLGRLNSSDSVKSGLADDLNPTKGSWLSGRADGGPVGGDRYYGKK